MFIVRRHHFPNHNPSRRSSSNSSSSSSNRITYCINYARVFNNLLRTMLLIVFGLANLNNGLTSNITKDNMNDELQRNINQKLIMSPSATLPVALLPPMEEFTASAGASSSAAQAGAAAASSSLSQFPYSLASISASSPSSSLSSSLSLSSSASSSSSSSSSSSLSASSAMTATYQRPSGSSITSFDSTNVIDDRQHQQQQHQQQHQQKQRQQYQQSQQHYKNVQLAKEIETRPLHLVVGVGNSNSKSSNVGGIGTALSGSENHIDVDGEEDTLNAFPPMYFGTENSTTVTTQIGATAHIPCTVHHIGDSVVSWIRRKDYHLLTVGLTTYSSDERFSATHLKHSEDWTLQIKFVQLRDAGVYECQVSTHPPTSIFLHLNVVEARAEISGPPIRYLTPGSTLRLQCRVVQNTEASEYIFWYHDNRMINYDIDRGINVSTDPDFQSSELTILRTRREHSGNFTCVASNTQPASVLVHIFKGDNPAAMYHGHVGSSTKSYQTHLHHIMVILVLSFRSLHYYLSSSWNCVIL